MGENVVPPDKKRNERKDKLRKEYFDFEGAGKYPQAYSVLVDILKQDDIESLDTALLSSGGEVCLRIKEIALAERVFEQVAKRGDLHQTVRALDILSRTWLKTPKQTTLEYLYKDSYKRFVNIDVFPEWVKLGEAFKS